MEYLKIVEIEITKKSISETLKYFSLSCFNAVEDRYIYNEQMILLDFVFLQGQYLTACFYGFITYYAFPDKWHEKPFLLLFIGVCSTFAIALGKGLKLKSMASLDFY